MVDEMLIQKYYFPKTLKVVLEFDRSLVHRYDKIMKNPCNITDTHTGSMLDSFIVYNCLRGLENGRKSQEFATDLLRTFNFFLEEQLLYRKELKQDLINKGRNDFFNMDKNELVNQFWIYKQFTPHPIDCREIWCSYTFAPRYLLRLLEFLPLYYATINRTWNMRVNTKLFYDMHVEFFTIVTNSTASIMGRTHDRSYRNYIDLIDSTDLLEQGYIFYGLITPEVSIFGRVLNQSSSQSISDSTDESMYEDDCPVRRRPPDHVCIYCGEIFRDS